MLVTVALDPAAPVVTVPTDTDVATALCNSARDIFLVTEPLVSTSTNWSSSTTPEAVIASNSVIFFDDILVPPLDLENFSQQVPAIAAR
jgi:hypothetical protein